MPERNVNASTFDDCAVNSATVDAIDRMRAVGTASDVAHTEGAALATYALCGEYCSKRGYCLNNNPDGTEESYDLCSAVEIFMRVGAIGNHDLSGDEILEMASQIPHTRYQVRF